VKAIQTEYLGFTNHKPSRIVAKAEGVPSITTTCGSLEIIAAERGWTHLDKHQVAARLLAEKQGWGATLVSGGLPDGTWCHCFVPESVVEALACADATLERIAPGGSRATAGTRDLLLAASKSLNI